MFWEMPRGYDKEKVRESLKKTQEGWKAGAAFHKIRIRQVIQDQILQATHAKIFFLKLMKS